MQPSFDTFYYYFLGHCMNPSDSDKKLLKSSNKRKGSQLQQGRKKRRIFHHGAAGPLNSKLARSAAAATNVVDDEEINEEFSNPEKLKEVTASTIVAVRSLLADTKDERTRRGKYVRYSAELRDEIAQFALENGSLEAASRYTEILGTSVSESE